jgi:hypothetical protein
MMEKKVNKTINLGWIYFFLFMILVMSCNMSAQASAGKTYV